LQNYANFLGTPSEGITRSTKWPG